MLANIPSSPASPPQKPQISSSGKISDLSMPAFKRNKSLASRMLQKIKVRPPSSDRPRKMSGYQIARSHMYTKNSQAETASSCTRKRCESCCSLCWSTFKLVIAFPAVILIWLVQQVLNILQGVLQILKSVILCPFARRYVVKTKLSLSQLNRIYRGSKPLLLVLDLDGTLIESTVQKPSFRDNSYFQMKLNAFAKEVVYVYRRPGLDEFLTAVSSFCELWVYTASEKEYADEILNNIDLNGLITKRFYRDSCVKVKNFQNPSGHSVTYQKGISQLKGANPHNTLIIDDNLNIFMNGQGKSGSGLENVIPIKKWNRTQRSDHALRDSLEIVCQVAKSGKDCRVALSNIRYSQ